MIRYTILENLRHFTVLVIVCVLWIIDLGQTILYIHRTNFKDYKLSYGLRKQKQN